MSDTPDLRVTTTPNFNLNLPDVGGDWDLWGDQTNNNWIFLDGALLPIWGGQMTGLLGLSGDPTTPLGAATRQYVDAVSARLGNYLPIAGGAMTGTLQLPPGAGPAAPSLQFYPGTGIYGPASGNVAISAAGVLVFTTSSIVARFSIPLQVAADPAQPLGVATKQYVDAVSGQLGNYLPLTGGQLTGPLITAAGSGGSLLGIGIGNNTTGLWTSGGNALVLQTGGATNLYLSPTGNTIGQSTTMATGTTFTLAADATQPMQAVTLQQMGAIVGGPYLPTAGGTLTGPLLLAANPTAALGAATKQYVDALGNTAAATYLPIAGGTLTGPLALAADPTTAPQAATKRYVDAKPALTSPRNVFHNGTFRVYQRPGAPWTANAYTVDRWAIYPSGGDTVSVTRINLADADRAAIGDERAAFALQNVFTGSANVGANNRIAHPNEDVRALAGKTVTVSFWARCLAGTMQIAVGATQFFGNGGSPSASVVVPAQNVAIGTVWARYAVQIVLPSIAGKTLGTSGGDCTVFNFYCSQQGNVVQSGTVQFWGMQCEIGTAASALEVRDLAAEWDACQRFFHPVAMYLGIFNTGAGQAAGTSATFLTPMRGTPTLTVAFNGSSNFNAGTPGLIGNSGVYMAGSCAAGGNTSINLVINCDAEL